jgi:lon-related putative ATP-dependent protease
MQEELAPDRLRRTCDTSLLDFRSTEELEPLAEIIGQERALRAVSFGIGMNAPGYHLYALGPAGTGRSTIVGEFLQQKASKEETPDDWFYVHNFADPDRPRALRLPAGKGCQLHDDMDKLVEELATVVPRAFEQKEYEQERQRIGGELDRQRKQLFEELEEKGKEEGITFLQTPHGVILAPLEGEEVLTPDRVRQLPEERQQQIEQVQQKMQGALQETMRAVQKLQRQSREHLMELDQKVVGFAVDHLISDLRERYAQFEHICEFLDQVRADLLDNVSTFKRLQQMEESPEKQLPVMLMQAAQQQASFDQYRINLIVDNCGQQGVPVVREHNPTFAGLIGRIDHQGQFGALVTNFRLIKPGALHRANGGYLMIEARDLLMRPLAYETLKRCLKTGSVKIEGMNEAYGFITTRTLEPEPIPLDVKVILLGDPLLYYTLYSLDPDFQELFKVKADFGERMEWSADTVKQYARFIGNVCRQEGLHHFAPAGVAKVVEHSARLVSHRERLATRFGDIVDLLRQASYWAGQSGRDLVSGEDVQQAIQEGIYRSNRLEERLQEMIAESTLRIDTGGEVVGQVNGLAVLSLGDYAFGKPSRITARTYVGTAGVISIDRESELGGRIHNKGSMILAGYLGGKFAGSAPLALTANVTFEQLYEPVEGDSASSTELYALLSSLSGFPIRQDVAVTGSVDQRGRVQAIGGVNEKIEGFFDVCRQQGLTGSQGVLIPEDNCKHLMLREDVVEAVADGRFHIFPVRFIDEGIALLTGRSAGEQQEDLTYPAGTVNGEVQRRLRELASRVREFARHGGGGSGDEGQTL